jgi:hypothetical protein
MPATCSYTVVDFAWIALQPSAIPGNQGAVLVHHVVTLALLAFPLCYPQLCLFACWDILAEFNTWFRILRRVLLGQHWQRLLALLYWATFFALRMVLYPLLLVYMYLEMRKVGPLWPGQKIYVATGLLGHQLQQHTLRVHVCVGIHVQERGLYKTVCPIDLGLAPVLQGYSMWQLLLVFGCQVFLIGFNVAILWLEVSGWLRRAAVPAPQAGAPAALSSSLFAGRWQRILSAALRAWFGAWPSERGNQQDRKRRGLDVEASVGASSLQRRSAVLSRQLVRRHQGMMLTRLQRKVPTAACGPTHRRFEPVARIASVPTQTKPSYFLPPLL